MRAVVKGVERGARHGRITAATPACRAEAAPTRARRPAPTDLAPIPYRLTCVRLGDQDGEAVLARLRVSAAGGGAWGPGTGDLELLPLMGHAGSTESVVREGLALAQALPEADRARPMGALLAPAYHEEGAAALDRLMEELMSTTQDTLQ